MLKQHKYCKYLHTLMNKTDSKNMFIDLIKNTKYFVDLSQGWGRLTVTAETIFKTNVFFKISEQFESNDQFTATLLHQYFTYNENLI